VCGSIPPGITSFPEGAIGFHIQLPSDDRDLFVLNQDVRGIIIDRRNNPAILY
jgi:hypothetical protein